MGGTKWGCSIKGRAGVLLRRLVDTDLDGSKIKIRTTEGRYDDIYQEADIAYASQGACDGTEDYSDASGGDGLDKSVCLGFNTDCKNGATQPLPLYSNQFITVTCSDCYYGWHADVVMKYVLVTPPDDPTARSTDL